METVAEKAGVSRALVSLVLNNSPKVSDQKRNAVLNAARELGYQPNLHARNLAQQRTQTIGVLVNDLHNPFFSEVVDGVEAEAELNQLRVLILNGGRDPEREQQAIDTFIQFRVEALVLIGPRLDDEQLLSASRHAPVIIVAAGRNHPDIDTITADDATGAHLAVNHLIQLGHRSILHIDGGANISAKARRDAYVDAMRNAQLEPRVLIGSDEEDGARQPIRELVGTAELPTAIFAFNDLLAAGVLDELIDSGVAVPDQVSIVGYDNTFIAGLRRLSLTTVNQPRHDMGRLAMRTVLERIEEGRVEAVHHDLQPTLVQRGTSAAPATLS